MRRKLFLVGLAAGAGVMALAGCGSKEVDYDTVSFEELTPEQQQQALKRQAEATKAAESGQPLPPEFITEEMLMSGQIVDGVLQPKGQAQPQ